MFLGNNSSSSRNGEEAAWRLWIEFENSFGNSSRVVPLFIGKPGQNSGQVAASRGCNFLFDLVKSPNGLEAFKCWFCECFLLRLLAVLAWCISTEKHFVIRMSSSSVDLTIVNIAVAFLDGNRSVEKLLSDWLKKAYRSSRKANRASQEDVWQKASRFASTITDRL